MMTKQIADFEVVKAIDWSRPTTILEDGRKIAYTFTTGTGGSKRARYQTGTGEKTHRVSIMAIRDVDGTVKAHGSTRCGLRTLSMDDTLTPGPVTCERCQRRS